MGREGSGVHRDADLAIGKRGTQRLALVHLVGPGDGHAMCVRQKRVSPLQHQARVEQRQRCLLATQPMGLNVQGAVNTLR